MNHHFFKLCTTAAVVTASLALSACDDDDAAAAPSAQAAGPFEFRTEPAAMYFRIDRMGQPATGTALLSRAPGSAPANPKSNMFNNFNNQRDVFNRDDPADDDANFLPLAAATLRTIHVELAPALRTAGLTPCSTGAGETTDISLCAAQAAPVISPDVITLNLANPDGWPNGRRFDDNVINRLLSAALLNVSQPVAPATAPPHTLLTLESLPLNPRNNDANPTPDPSPAEFPYIRPAHPAGV